MSASTISRPTENAAVGRTREPSYRLPLVLADMTTANRLNDREGLLLLACRAVRATTLGVGE